MLPDASADNLTLWLRRMSAGEAEAADHVASVVYQELRRLASSALNGQNSGHSLQPTLLVNEAFLKLLKGQPIDWQDRGHFFALASRMMRRIVVDYFRSRRAEKRPPRDLAMSLLDQVVFSDDRREEVMLVDEALHKLSEVDSRAAKVVEMRYFGGFTVAQTAEILGVADRTVKRDWEMAQWWLKSYIGGLDTAAGAGA